MTRLSKDQIELVLAEVEKRWRERTPPESILDAEPESRVNRTEVNRIISDMGLGNGHPLFDDDWDLAIFKLYDRLRLEFPDEKWTPPKGWTARTKDRRRELGLKSPK